MLKVNELLDRSNKIVSSIATISLGLAVITFAAVTIKENAEKLFSRKKVKAHVICVKSSTNIPETQVEEKQTESPKKGSSKKGGSGEHVIKSAKSDSDSNKYGSESRIMVAGEDKASGGESLDAGVLFPNPKK